MYEAFNDQNSDGMRHLRELAKSGLKAVHILPSFHFASVNEDKSTWQTTGDLSQYPPDGQQQQAAVGTIQCCESVEILSNWRWKEPVLGLPGC
jgi:pullulanase